MDLSFSIGLKKVSDLQYRTLYSALPIIDKLSDPTQIIVITGVPIAANIIILLLLAYHNNYAASAVAIDTAVANVISTVGLPWVPAVVIVSAVAGVPSDLLFLLLLTSQELLMKLKSLTTAIDIPPAILVSNVSSILTIVAVPAVDGIPSDWNISPFC